MRRFLEYTFFFVVLVLLQIFLFSNLNISVYIHPLVYTAFIILLPMRTLPVAVLLSGLMLGVIMDFFTGAGGLNTIASLFTAFVRPLVITLVAGRDEVKEGGIPTVWRLGPGKYLRYTVILIFLHNLVYFTFESLSWQYYYLTFLRIILSTAVTVALVYFIQMLLPGSRSTIQSRGDNL